MDVNNEQIVKDRRPEADVPKKTVPDLKNKAVIFGIAVGVISVLMGIAVLTKSYDFYHFGWVSTTFGEGGNYYTYAYTAACHTADNIGYLGKIIQQAGGFLLIVIGLSDIAFFGMKFTAGKE